MWSCGHVVVVVPRVEKDLGWSYMFYLGNLHDRLSQAIELRPQDVQPMPTAMPITILWPATRTHGPPSLAVRDSMCACVRDLSLQLPRGCFNGEAQRFGARVHAPLATQFPGAYVGTLAN